MSAKQSVRPHPLSSLGALLLQGALIGGIGLLFVSSPPSQVVEFSSNESEQVTAAAVPSQVVALRRAIIGQESNANFLAVNPHSGALGYGQVMPFNVPSWTREALGYTVSTQDFLNSPEIQLQVIDYKLNQYWQAAWQVSGGDEDVTVRQVASRWYSGNPYYYTSTRPQYYNGHPYPSISDYGFSVLRRYKQHLNHMVLS